MTLAADKGMVVLQSNEWTGKRSFNNRCLHDTRGPGLNPYEEAFSIIARTLAPFDDDDEIPIYGFGDGTLINRITVAASVLVLNVEAMYYVHNIHLAMTDKFWDPHTTGDTGQQHIVASLGSDG